MDDILTKIADLLKAKKLKISCAESCTGGLLASCLTDISGASEYLDMSFVTYSNEAKENILNVKHETLLKYGAVSENTAEEMASGLLKRANCDIAVSITGIAGPTGGSIEKPVGLAYIGIANKDKIIIKKIIGNSKSTRKELKLFFANQTFENLYKFLVEL